MIAPLYAFLACLAFFALGFVCALTCKRPQRTVVMRPNEAQWALLETQQCHMRTLARLKMQLTHAEDTNQDLRDRLAAQAIELAALKNISTHQS